MFIITLNTIYSVIWWAENKFMKLFYERRKNNMTINYGAVIGSAIGVILGEIIIYAITKYTNKK